MQDAPDLSGKYNTKLSEEEERRFQEWAARAGRQNDVADYDLRGAWKNNAKEAENGHLPDKWKKPNHPTFSNESAYNGADGAKGGRWIKLPGGKWAFEPSDTNLRNLGPEELQRYFKEAEPDVELRLPRAAVLYPREYGAKR